MLIRRTLAGAVMLSAAIAAPVQAASPPPKRLWYRIEASVDVAKFGDFTSPAFTEHRSTHLKAQLKSRSAVLLYRQCTALGIDNFDPRLVARVIDFNRAAVDCAQTRRFMRRVGFSRHEIRSARLVDDVRFSARGDGVANQFERRSDVPARVEGTPAGAVVDCPPQTLDVVRITSAAPVEGAVRTASAVRDGVGVEIGAAPTRLDNVEVGSEGGPCIIRSTGAPWTTPRLIRGAGAASGVFGWRAGYGYLPAPALVRFKIGDRFGTSFDVEGAGVVKEPLGNGTWETAGTTELTFRLCPRGGRDVSGC
jgi:hypothetical protein